jgi:hypothetical protein
MSDVINDGRRDRYSRCTIYYTTITISMEERDHKEKDIGKDI